MTLSRLLTLITVVVLLGSGISINARIAFAESTCGAGDSCSSGSSCYYYYDSANTSDPITAICLTPAEKTTKERSMPATAKMNPSPNSSSGGQTIGGNGASGGQTMGGNNATPTTGGLLNPLKATTLPELLNEILGYAVQLGTIFLTIMIVYVGFLFVQARGNAEGISKARTALLWTVIGGILLLGASAIAKVIEATVGGLTTL